jgi:hypothetical protein
MNHKNGVLAWDLLSMFEKGLFMVIGSQTDEVWEQTCIYERFGKTSGGSELY